MTKRYVGKILYQHFQEGSLDSDILRGRHISKMTIRGLPAPVMTTPTTDAQLATSRTFLKANLVITTVSLAYFSPEIRLAKE